MKIIRNDKFIKRNGRIGQATSLVALAILALGMYISFQRPELFVYSAASLLVGFTLTQISMYLGNRFGRSPRPDEKLDAGLKGLPGDFTIYHYEAPTPHLLVGPAGVWVLLPYQQRGVVSYRSNRWRMSGGGLIQGYMRIFGQESLGRPDLEAENEIRAVRKLLTKSLAESELPEIRAALIFTGDGVEIDADGSPMPALKLKQLKDFLRREARQAHVPPAQRAAIQSLLSD